MIKTWRESMGEPIPEQFICVSHELMQEQKFMQTEIDALRTKVDELEAAAKLALRLLEAGDLLCEVFAAVALRKAILK